jgi:gamma-tubulin complex component 3
LLRLGKQRVVMASFNHERVGHALDELLQRIVPDDPNDTEEAAEQRLQEAYDFSMQQLIAAGEPKAVPDVNHIVSLLETKSENCISRLSMWSPLTARQLLDQPKILIKPLACTISSDVSKTSRY